MIIHHLVIHTDPYRNIDKILDTSMGYFKAVESANKYVESKEFKNLLKCYEENSVPYIGYHVLPITVKEQPSPKVKGSKPP